MNRAPRLDIQKQLFTRTSVYLGPIDHENDPPIISRWSHDPEYLSLVEVTPVYPLSVGQVQKKLEAIEKQIDDSRDLYYFTIRARQDDRLLGFASIRWIDWLHDTGWVHLGIGDRHDWRKGYGTEALDMLLEYAFDELNLYRLGGEMVEYNLGARRLFETAGFQQEVCRRKAVSRDGRQWNLLLYGLLRPEWEARRR